MLVSISKVLFYYDVVMTEITDERINQLRLSIHRLRVFLNYSNSMKKKNNESSKIKISKNKKFNEDKISTLDSSDKNKLNNSPNIKSSRIDSKNNLTETNKSNNNKEVKEVNKKITLLPGKCAVEQGESGSSAFLILSGSFNVEIDKKVVGSMSAGEIFGELSLILGEKRKATVRAITGSELVEINPSFLDDYLLSSKTTSEKMSKPKLEIQNIIKELSVELGKKEDQKLPIEIEKLDKLLKDESNIIKSLSIQLHKRLSRMISDASKKEKISKL